MTVFIDRADERLQWLRAVRNDASLTLEPASADASFRSYWRTAHGGQSWIVMDSPPALEDPAPWLALGARLADAGLHVPAVAAVDGERGLLLIEDLGSRLYLPALNDASVEALYGDAMTALLRMQTRVDAASLAPYDTAFLRHELELLPEWFLARHLGHHIDGGERAVLDRAFETLIANARAQPQCFVHRDFHSRNLLVIESDDAVDTDALPTPGIIDFQGALRGPITYDLASLLRDCYIAWDDARVDAWVEDYRKRLQVVGLIEAPIDRALFLRWFDLTGLQRHLKVLGLFCRLAYRDGKHGYLGDLPLVVRYVLATCRRYSELRALADLLERYVDVRTLTQARSA